MSVLQGKHLHEVVLRTAGHNSSVHWRLGTMKSRHNCLICVRHVGETVPFANL